MVRPVTQEMEKMEGRKVEEVEICDASATETAEMIPVIAMDI